MKKLMIAAAATAMVGGVFATDCPECEKGSTTTTCTPEVYKVQFTLKTLTWKAISGDCPGTYMEQGTRKLEGALWSCCSVCGNWDPATVGTYPFQYSLWEKSTQNVFTDGMAWGDGASKTTTYTAKATFAFGTAGRHAIAQSAYIYGSAAAAYAQGLSVAAEHGLSKNFEVITDEEIASNEKYRYEAVTYQWGAAAAPYPYATTVPASDYIYDTEDAAKAAAWAARPALWEAAAEKEAKTLADMTATIQPPTATGFFNYTLVLNGQSAEMVYGAGYRDLAAATTGANAFATTIGAALVNGSVVIYNPIEGGVETKGSYVDTPANITAYRFSKKANKVEALWIVDPDTDGRAGAGKQTTEAGSGEADTLYLVAAGFGTTIQDGDLLAIKSVSGNCAGMIVPVAQSVDCFGQITDMCDDTIDWCSGEIQANYGNTFASGTWSITYVKSLKNGVPSLAPSWAKANSL